MEDPKTVAELQEWVEYQISLVRGDMNSAEIALVAEIILAPYDKDEMVQDFTEDFKLKIKHWPLNKKGVA